VSGASVSAARNCLRSHLSTHADAWLRGAIDKYWVSSIMTHPARRTLLVPLALMCHAGDAANRHLE
jgi:hypothetical protein